MNLKSLIPPSLNPWVGWDRNEAGGYEPIIEDYPHLCWLIVRPDVGPVLREDWLDPRKWGD